MSGAGIPLEVSGVSLSLDGRNILSDVAFSVGSGDFICMVGRNGAGKSSIFKCVVGIYKNFSGVIEIGGARSSEFSDRNRAKLVAYVPQSASLDVPYTVREFMEMARYPWRGVSTAAEDARYISEALMMTGAIDVAERRMNTLSGGERQKVMIASAVAQNTGIIVLDEPTSYLDYEHQAEAAEVMARVNSERGVTLLAVTHDINLAMRVSRRIIALADGRVFWNGPPSGILEDGLLQSIYGVPFESYFPRSGGDWDYPLLAPVMPGGCQSRA
ncbi:MAG: ABC transporter ATP-binding protein [Synergistaceae bacterium]|jgi:iron complex transport system ATP-binding protein|nr:ABC transporter ATP-binding protein [Synergistaceae bacterium]